MDTLGILLFSAIGIGFVHTLIGIDHTLPFVVLGRARGWSLRKTLLITSLCGSGHVASSVLLGGIGIAIAMAATGVDRQEGAPWLASRLGAFESLEATRGNLAAWALIVFGVAYAAWSMARRRRDQRDAHKHPDGVVHSHPGGGTAVHSHNAPSTGNTPSRQPGNSRAPGQAAGLTAWSLFVIFVLGPCEPLIPLLMVPAFGLGLWAVVPVTAAFAITTLTTMLVLVAAGFYGLRRTYSTWLEAQAHVLSGLAIAGSGMAILLLSI